MDGVLLSFEGSDGCGKSTQLRMLAEYLEEKGLNVLKTREPGGCAAAEAVRDILLNPELTGLDDYTEALLYAAARAQHVREVILPALKQGRVVLCDRYIDSSIAYQGYGRGLGLDTISDLNKYSVGGVMPARTFFLDVPPAVSFARGSKAEAGDRIEREEADFHERVYRGYLELAERWPGRITRIDASGTKEATQKQIRQAAQAVLRAEGILHA